MNARLFIRPLPRRRWFFRVGLFLLAFTAVTFAVREWHLSRIERDPGTVREEVVARAFAEIEADWAALQQALIDEARHLAADPRLRAALAGYDERSDAADLDALLQSVAAYRLPERGAVEVYGVAGELLAWNGQSIPADASPIGEANADTFRVAMVADAGHRRAMTITWPVPVDGRIVGHLRVVRFVAVRTPVENQYLQSFDLSDTWRRLTRLPVEVRFDDALPEGILAERLNRRPIRDVHGRVLGTVFLEGPETEEMLDAARRRYADLGVVGMALLVVLAVFGVWQWARVGAVVRLFAFLAALWMGRFAWYALEVPARWQRDKAPLAPLFDPSHFASDYGFGLMSSMGDLFTTAVFLIVSAAAVWYRLFPAPAPATRGSAWRIAIAALGLAALAQIQGQAMRHAVLDSTLDYFARTGLLPGRLVLFVFCALMVLAIGAAAVGVALARHAFAGRASALRFVCASVMASVACGALSRGLEQASHVPVAASIGFACVCLGAGWALARQEREPGDLFGLPLRRLSAFALVLIVPAYLMLERSLDVQLRTQMVEAIDTFDAERDAGLVFAVEQMLDRARADGALRGELAAPARPENRRRLDALAEELVVGSALANLGTHEVSFTVFDREGAVRGRALLGDMTEAAAIADEADREDFVVLTQIYVEQSDGDSTMVDLMTGRRVPERLQYEGFAPLSAPDSVAVGWALVRIEPKTIVPDAAALFPRVLLPASVLQVQTAFAIAEFRDGAVYRNAGSTFGRFRLDEPTRRLLRVQPSLWRFETDEGRRYLVYYARRQVEGERVPAPFDGPERVLAVRVPVLNLFDHLYYMLRMTLAMLLVLAVLYVVVWLVRKPGARASRRRFTDRVLNAFLSVGLAAVLVVSVLGIQVIDRENENAVRGWIDQQLDRVETNLALQAGIGELPADVLGRVDVGALAASVGLDLNVYRGYDLYASSRRQLVRERLIDTRLPPAVYRPLFFAGDRNAFTVERVGTFSYTAGYRALPDRQGRPLFVISVPTLPEQERIEEERARTVAYLFGSLLLLMLAVTLTAGLLANALAGPIGRLRQGLEAVARGRYEQPLPVETDDEIGELVDTFNQMQEQLSESRRQLTQQERQLAWREMARQVAHEIKNPLTPMKLSVQHLRRAFTDARGAGGDPRFASLFERITATLIEQVDALARIANEFSSFARMPTQILETLDLNAVIQEASDLMREQQDVSIELRLHPVPLLVRGDREELRRIYINLIKNAIEATHDGRPNRIEVMSEARVGDGRAEAYTEIHDEGTGIDPALREKIFEPNFSSKTSGTGLGLAIVRKGVEDMLGTIGFDTEAGVGTTFRVSFPLAPTA